MTAVRMSMLGACALFLGFFASAFVPGVLSPTDVGPTTSSVAKKPGDRQPAGATQIVPGFGGKPSLLVKLNFVCSPWLYLNEPKNPALTPDQINNDACENYANVSRLLAQKFFDNSRVPVVFTSSTNVQASRVAFLLGSNQISKADRIANANQNRMPGLVVTDADINYVQTSPGSPAVPATPDTKYVLPNNGGCVPWLFQPSCPNPASTTVTYSGGSTAACKFYPNLCTSNGGYTPATNPQTGQSVCTYNAGYCAGLGPNCKMPVPCYCTLTPGFTQYSIPNCPFQGPAQAGLRDPPPAGSGGYNACWCAVFTNPGNPGSPAVPATYAWQSSTATPYVFYQTEPFDNILEWIASQGLAPAIGESAITIAVTPAATAANCGAAKALYDPVTQFYVVFGASYSVVKTQFGPADYFSKLGKLAVASNCTSPTLVSHEIGHAFGAIHEREWELLQSGDQSYYTLTGLLRRDVSASLVEFPSGALGTTMMWHTGGSEGYFSTSAFRGANQLPLSTGFRNNRGQIMRNLTVAAGQNLEYVPDPNVEVVKIINQMLLKPKKKK